MAKRKENNPITDDEIDLTPFINRVLKRKWLVVFAVVISAVAVYFISYLLPVKYSAVGTLTFKGYRRIEGTSSDYVQSPIISAASVVGLVEKTNNEEIDGLEDVFSIAVAGEDYPLTITIETTSESDIQGISSTILSYLNSNQEVQAELESQREFVSTRLDNANSTLGEVNTQVQNAKQSLFSCSANSAAMGSAYADLVSLQETLTSDSAALQQELDSLQGFTYVAEPYLSNNGEPVSPNKLRNGLIAAFGAGVIAVGISSIIKTKDE